MSGRGGGGGGLKEAQGDCHSIPTQGGATTTAYEKEHKALGGGVGPGRGGGGGRDLLELRGEGGRGSRGEGSPPGAGMKIKASPWGGGGSSLHLFCSNACLPSEAPPPPPPLAIPQRVGAPGHTG